jgi:hypothetical protein
VRFRVSPQSKILSLLFQHASAIALALLKSISFGKSAADLGLM